MISISRRAALGGLAGAVASTRGAFAQTPSWILPVGAVFPMTGPDASIGETADFALRTTVEIVHGDYDLDLPLARTDNLPKLPGARLRAVMADHRGDPERARAEARKLISEGKVVALLGAGDERVTEALVDVAEQARVPFIDTDSTNPEFRARQTRFTYRMACDDAARAATTMEFLARIGDKFAPVRAINLVHDKDPEDMRMARLLRAAAANVGIAVASQVPHLRGQPEAAIAGLRQARAADAVVMLGSPRDASRMPQASTETRASSVICLPVRAADRAQATIHTTARRLLVVNGFARDARENDPNIAAINTLYRSIAKRDLDEPSALQFTAFLTLAFAINEARGVSPAAIADKLGAATFPGDRTVMPWETLRFDAAGRNVGASVVIAQRQAERVVTVYPPRFATAQVDWRG